MRSLASISPVAAAPVLLAVGLAGAQTCPAPTGAAPALGGIDGAARLDWIDARLASTAHKSSVWVWGWGIGLGVGTVANLAPVPFVGHSLRIDLVTGAVTTAIGLPPLILMAPAAIADARALHAAMAARPEAAARCGLLADAERRLERDAEDEAFGRGWWMHAANVALNGGVGLFLVLGYHHDLAGLLNFVGGAAVGEAMIFTLPVDARDDLRRYRQGDLGPPTPRPPPTAWMLLPALGPRAVGLQLALMR